MKRLTVDKSAREMTGTELAHNCMYACDRWARYRDFDKDMDLFDFIREFAKAEKKELPADNEVAAEMLLDGLQYGIDNPFGRVALVYNLMWAMADLREVLKAYEDTGLTPKEIIDGRILTGWIPVMERLPDHEDKYWCTFSDGTTGTCLFMIWRNGGSFNIPASATRIDPNLSVIAWQPLPPAYQRPAQQEARKRPTIKWRR